MACTGLPEPQPDHAIRMARFARACMNKVPFVLRSLEDSLGPGTMDLGMRVGIHSGPVTAGVLRGEKSRFQLFGDTMNTAARMESNGKKHAIQVSETTAELILADKNCRDILVIPREDMIEAKGKGQMRTFWVQVTGLATGSVLSSNIGTLVGSENPSVDADESTNFPSSRSNDIESAQENPA